MQGKTDHFLKHIEGKFFLVGLAMLFASLVYLVVIFSHDAVMGNKIISMVAAEIFGGRSTGLPLGLQQGVPLFKAVIFSVSQDLVILYLLAPLVTIFYHRVNKEKFIGWLLERTRKQAEQNKEGKLFGRKFQYLAVLLFIWIPFYMTGTFVGFVVAILLGISVKRALYLASFATTFGAITWALAFSRIIALLEKAGEFLPALIIFTILGIIIIKHVLNYLEYRREKKLKSSL